MEIGAKTGTETGGGRRGAPAPLRAGEDEDYTIWLAHSSDPRDPSDGCILGYKEQFRRLRKSSVCQNGRDYAVTAQPSVCPCTLHDFLWYRCPPLPPCPSV